MTTTPDAPKLDRPRFHVWVGEGPDDDAPAYVGAVTITNADQLTAEIQARGLGLQDMKGTPFHTTNLWIWAAMVRKGLTSDKFKPFTARMEYRPVDEDDQVELDADPTNGAPGPSTDSA